MFTPGFIVLIFLVSLVGLELPLHGTDDVMRRMFVCLKNFEGGAWRGSVDQSRGGIEGIVGLRVLAALI
jgi:hypothetical protein